MFTSDDALKTIAEGLIACTLPKPAWTHAAHFAAALYLLARRPDLNRQCAMPGIIRAYNLATGVANTPSSFYHETITQASLRAARAPLAARPDEALFVVCNALLASKLGRPGWLAEDYSDARLFSAAARLGWVDPDVRALPF